MEQAMHKPQITFLMVTINLYKIPGNAEDLATPSPNHTFMAGKH